MNCVLVIAFILGLLSEIWYWSVNMFDRPGWGHKALVVHLGSLFW